MNRWGKMMRKAWTKLSKRIDLREHGALKLHQEVRSCEYEDVHILWEMLKRNQSNLTTEKDDEQYFWKLLQWSKCSPLL